MKKRKPKLRGFSYHLSRETLKAYQRKSYRKRLEWLYQGNLFRMHYPPEIIALQDKFRKAEI